VPTHSLSRGANHEPLASVSESTPEKDLTVLTHGRSSGEAMNPLQALQGYGQSVWLDYIRHRFFGSGKKL
jgi:hypothetical protein